MTDKRTDERFVVRLLALPAEWVRLYRLFRRPLPIDSRVGCAWAAWRYAKVNL